MGKTVLTNYYKFERVPGTASKSKIVCTASTKDYKPLEVLRATRARKAGKNDAINVGDLFLYYGNIPDNFSNDAKAKADKCLTKTNNVSSISMLPRSTVYGHGDMKGTPDALLFKFKDAEVTEGKLNDGAVIEIFIAKGQAQNQRSLCSLMADGALDDEVQALREKARSEKLKDADLWDMMK